MQRATGARKSRPPRKYGRPTEKQPSAGTCSVNSGEPGLAPPAGAALTCETMPTSEPFATALLLAIAGLLLGASVLFSRASNRIGVPIVLLFLCIGMLAGSEGLGGIDFDDYGFAFRLGVAGAGAHPVRRRAQHPAGGSAPRTGRRPGCWPRPAWCSPRCSSRCRRTSGGSAGPRRCCWARSCRPPTRRRCSRVLRGSGLQLKRRVGATLEIESGLNDPVAVILTTALTAQPAPPGRASSRAERARDGGSSSPIGAARRLALGLRRPVDPLAGFSCRRAGSTRPSRSRSRCSPSGSRRWCTAAGSWRCTWRAWCWATGPCPTAPACCGCTTRSPGWRRSGCSSSSGCWCSRAGCSEVAPARPGPGPAARVRRPAAGGGALPGAVPLSAARGALHRVGRPPGRGADRAGHLPGAGRQRRGADRIFNLVFFIVVVNAIVPGGTVAWVTRRLGLQAAEPPAPQAVLAIESRLPLKGELMSFYIDEALVVTGRQAGRAGFSGGGVGRADRPGRTS